MNKRKRHFRYYDFGCTVCGFNKQDRDWVLREGWDKSDFVQTIHQMPDENWCKDCRGILVKDLLDREKILQVGVDAIASFPPSSTDMFGIDVFKPGICWVIV